MKNNLCILVPAYNEELNIQEVIRELKSIKSKFQIVVIDDGSTDKTSRFAKKEGAIVLINKKNCGSGVAMRNGFNYALSKNYSYAIQMDGDGQHNPKEIFKILRILKNNKVDMVIGSRYVKKTTYKTPAVRYVCIQILVWLFLFLYDFRISDPTSGYRGFTRKTMRFLMDHYKDGYPEALSIAALISQGYKIKEVSVTMRPRMRGKSSINLFSGFYHFLIDIFGILKYRLSNF